MRAPRSRPWSYPGTTNTPFEAHRPSPCPEIALTDTHQRTSRDHTSPKARSCAHRPPRWRRWREKFQSCRNPAFSGSPTRSYSITPHMSYSEDRPSSVRPSRAYTCAGCDAPPSVLRHCRLFRRAMRSRKVHTLTGLFSVGFALALFVRPISSSAVPSSHGSDADLLVHTTSGLIQGFSDTTTTEVPLKKFLGVPFAADTSDANRWQPPQPVKVTPGKVINATAFGPACMQGRCVCFNELLVVLRYWVLILILVHTERMAETGRACRARTVCSSTSWHRAMRRTCRCTSTCSKYCAVVTRNVWVD